MESQKKNFIKKETIKQEFDEYRKFAYRKNMFSVALAFVLATSIQKFSTSISECIFMPVINYIVSSTGDNWRNLIFIPVNGMEIELGKFIGSFIEFTIITILVYIIFSKIIKRISPDAEIELSSHLNHQSEKHK